MVSGPEGCGQLVYLFGEGGDLLRHPPVAAPLQRSPDPLFGILDKEPSYSLRVVEHHGLPPAGNGGADGTGVRNLQTVRFRRPRSRADEQPAATFEPE